MYDVIASKTNYHLRVISHWRFGSEGIVERALQISPTTSYIGTPSTACLLVHKIFKGAEADEVAAQQKREVLLPLYTPRRFWLPNSSARLLSLNGQHIIRNKVMAGYFPAGSAPIRLNIRGEPGKRAHI